MTWYFSSCLQVVLKGDPKKLSLHGVRINLSIDFHHPTSVERETVQDDVTDLHTSLPLPSPHCSCLSHSRHVPCVWRTSKWKTSWECCHANMLSTGSECNYQSFFSPLLVWADLRPRWMEEIWLQLRQELPATAADGSECDALQQWSQLCDSWWKQRYSAGKLVRLSCILGFSQNSRTPISDSQQPLRSSTVVSGFHTRKLHCNFWIFFWLFSSSVWNNGLSVAQVGIIKIIFDLLVPWERLSKRTQRWHHKSRSVFMMTWTNKSFEIENWPIHLVGLGVVKGAALNRPHVYLSIGRPWSVLSLNTLNTLNACRGFVNLEQIISFIRV